MFRSAIALIVFVSASSATAQSPAAAPAGTTNQSTNQKTSDPKLKEAALKMVPNAKVISEDGNEFDLQTAQGTTIELELNKDGTIDEASGDAVNGGDTFAPGNGLIDLKAAIAALGKAGKSATGDWSFEKSFLNDWVYEFEGMENGKQMDYAISAKDGSLVKNRRDLF